VRSSVMFLSGNCAIPVVREAAGVGASATLPCSMEHQTDPAAGSPPEPVARRLDHVYYWVNDMDRAVAFYRDVLGLPLARRDGDEWAEFDAGGVRLALHGAVHGHAPPPGGAAVVFEVADLDIARATLAARGVSFGHEGDVEGYARFLTFTDPDGNTLQVIEYASSG
jgi:catechol 2,3-dioxygenase-like lactoylglutathione lyase family enzyme